jgi:hypothetical protein
LDVKEPAGYFGMNVFALVDHSSKYVLILLRNV